MAATRPTPIDGKTRGPAPPVAFRTAPVTTILIVAARPSARAGLRAMLATAPRLAPVVLAAGDLELPDESAALRELGARPAIVLIDQTGFDADRLRPLVQVAREDGLPMLWLGAPAGMGEIAPAGAPWGILAPDTDQEVLVAAIHALAVGLAVADPAVLPPPKAESAVPPPAVTLTAREQEVLDLVAAGLPNKAIARALGISDHTAKFHVSALLGKLDAASRTEAVTIATRMGLLSV